MYSCPVKIVFGTSESNHVLHQLSSKHEESLIIMMIQINLESGAIDIVCSKS